MSEEINRVLEHRSRVEAFMREHRTGLVAMVFTDLEGSTRLKQVLGDREAVALIQAHHGGVRRMLGQFEEAEEINTAGDSFFMVFTKASDAVRFALMVQPDARRLSEGLKAPLRDRMGIHIGEVVVEKRLGAGRDLFGIQVDTCARVMDLARGGQVLLTRAAFDNARQVLKGEDLAGVGPMQWLNHGLYALKGVDEALEICEVGEVGLAPLEAPADTQKGRRQTGGDGEPVMGWRPAAGQSVPGTGWHLLRKLGEGGFGEVWLGRNQRMKEERVFKFCFRADRVRSLKRELTIWRVLKERLGSDPRIVPVREVNFEEPPYYLMMDYSAGRDLASWCEQRGGVLAVPLGERLEILAQVAEALGAAHEAGVIHRDVKPGNILVEEKQGEGIRVRLTDFGIGEITDRERVAGVTMAGFTETLSEGGTQAGSQMYRAPELWSGGQASSASDVYSLGVVMYQLCVGSFKEPLAPDWKRRIPGTVLREFLMKPISGDPAKRPPSAPALARQLRELDRRQRKLVKRAAKTRKSEIQKCRFREVQGEMMLLGSFNGMIAVLPLEVPEGLVKFLSALAAGGLGLGLLAAGKSRYRGGLGTLFGGFFLGLSCLIGAFTFEGAAHLTLYKLGNESFELGDDSKSACLCLVLLIVSIPLLLWGREANRSKRLLLDELYGNLAPFERGEADAEVKPDSTGAKRTGNVECDSTTSPTAIRSGSGWRQVWLNGWRRFSSWAGLFLWIGTWLAAFVSVCRGLVGGDAWLLALGWFIAACKLRARPGGFMLMSGAAWMAMGLVSGLGNFRANRPVTVDLVFLHVLFFLLPALLFTTAGWRRLGAISAQGHGGTSSPGLGNRILETAKDVWSLLTSPDTPPSALDRTEIMPHGPGWTRSFLRTSIGLAAFSMAAIATAAVGLGSATDLNQGAAWFQMSALLLAASGGAIAFVGSRSPARSLDWACGGLFLIGWGFWKFCLGFENWPTLDLRESVIAVIYLALGAVAFIRGRHWFSARWSGVAGPWFGLVSFAKLRPSIRLPAKKTTVCTICGVIGVIGLYQVENWRGSVAWEKVGSLPSTLGDPRSFNELVREEKALPRLAPVLKSSWLMGHFYYRPVSTPGEEGAFSLLSGSRRRLRQHVEVSQIRHGTNLDEVGTFEFQGISPIDAVRFLARESGLTLLTDQALVDRPLGTTSMRFEGVSRRQALEATLKNYNLVLFAGDSGAVFRLMLTKMDGAYSGSFERSGSNYWLTADCPAPKFHAEVTSAGQRTSEILSKLRQTQHRAASDLNETFRFNDGALLPKVLEVLAERLEINVFFEPAVGLSVLGNCVLEGRAEPLCADLIDLFALGFVGDPKTGIHGVRAAPRIPTREMVTRISHQEASIHRVREAARSLLSIVSFDGVPHYTSDFFMGPRRLSPEILFSMVSVLQMSANVLLWDGRNEEATLDLEAIRGLIAHSQRTPLLETWFLFSTGVSAYCDVAAGGVVDGRWSEPQLKRILDNLRKIDPKKEIERRLAAEEARTQFVLRHFSSSVIVQSLSQLDRDPTNRVTAGERARLGLYALITLACPKGWHRQNQAACADYFAQLSALAGVGSPTNAPMNVAQSFPNLNALIGEPAIKRPLPWHPYRYLAELSLRSSASRVGARSSFLNLEWESVQKALEETRAQCAAALRKLEEAK